VALASGAPLDPPTALFAYVGTQLGTADAMVAASVAFQGVTSRLAAAVLVANEELGVGLEAPFAAVRWRATDRGVRLGLVEVHTGTARPWSDAVRHLIADAFVPWVAAVRRHVQIGERLLWGNAAASLLSANRDRAAETLDALPVGGLAVLGPSGGPAYRRTTCCLIDKAPGYGRCGECSLIRPTRVRDRS
jgi:iron complex transport system ATP-binding protein